MAYPSSFFMSYLNSINLASDSDRLLVFVGNRHLAGELNPFLQCCGQLTRLAVVTADRALFRIPKKGVPRAAEGRGTGAGGPEGNGESVQIIHFGAIRG
jgi:hypothetical protein